MVPDGVNGHFADAHIWLVRSRSPRLPARGRNPVAPVIAALPKAELHLHLHLEGTLEPELELELAHRSGVDIGQSTVAEVRAT